MNLIVRKKPVIVQAFKWTGDNEQEEDPIWIKEAIERGDVYFSCEGTSYCTMRIKTLEGTMSADLGDYIICGIKGEIYPCKPDIFEKTYEIVDALTQDMVGLGINRCNCGCRLEFSYEDSGGKKYKCLGCGNLFEMRVCK